MRTATKQEAINGNSNDTVITPLRLKQVLSNVDINPGEGGGSSDAPVYTAGDGISIINNVISNTITKTSQLTNDSNFITEADLPDINIKDPVPINSIWDYEGDTVPDGFIEIDPVAIPTKTSELENDSNFINQIKTINGQSLVGEGDITIEGGTGGSGGSSEIEVETINVPLINYDFVTGDYVNKSVSIKKCGNLCIVDVHIEGCYKLQSGEQRHIATIPEAYRPKEAYAETVFMKREGYDAFYDAGLIVSNSGKITIEQWSGLTVNLGQILGKVVYFLDEPLVIPGGGGSSSEEIETITVPAETGLNENNPSLVIDDFIKIRKYGKLCVISIRGGLYITLKNGTAKTVANIPEGYRPIENFGNKVTIKNDPDWELCDGSCVIYSDGRINIEQWSGKNIWVGQILGQFSYFVE